MKCPLCDSNAIVFENFYRCPECHLVFKDFNNHLNENDEKNRYLLHENDRIDKGYLDFLKKILEPIRLEDFKNKKILDFGSGPHPILSSYLKDLGHDVDSFDKYFSEIKLSDDSYDLILASEVFEHFREPKIELENILKLLKKGGILGIRTKFLKDHLEYKTWWYKNDPTHIVFYSDDTFNYLAKTYQLKILFSDNDSIIYFKKDSI